MSNADRDILKLAAKAAGFYYSFTDVDSLMWVSIDNENWTPWNPLANDGEAFRLAVDLRFDMMFYSDTKGVFNNGMQFAEINLADPEAACRRAIVRAAAEIGKAMP